MIKEDLTSGEGTISPGAEKTSVVRFSNLQVLLYVCNTGLVNKSISIDEDTRYSSVGGSTLLFTIIGLASWRKQRFTIPLC